MIRLMGAVVRRVQFFVWLLPPSGVKNSLLTAAGHRVHSTARVGPIIVLGCPRVEIGRDAVIGPLNVLRSMRRIHLGDQFLMGQLNYISAAREFQAFDEEAGVLTTGTLAVITNRHYLDSSGIIELGTRVIVGGTRVIMQTHEADLSTCTQVAGRITLAEGSMVATGCLLLKGSFLPRNSMLAAGSLLRGTAGEQEKHLYAGRPAAPVRELPPMHYWIRDTNDMPPSAVEF